ncbi:hypothetical protein [Yersinia sp. Marseille-Q3913]|nr:hypothetical protein [Yersinia sp. Marseille-Q3913]MBS0057096.1 hypothetical protein [Yersinia sp. Marseille-Q3913]
MAYNEFCKVDDLGFPKFTGFDFFRYKLLPKNMDLVTGEYYLWAYKASYLIYHKNFIINVAREERIPVLLLAGVAVSEVGGMPDRLKSAGVLQFRQLIIDTMKGDNTSSNSTSVGLIAMQIKVVAETIGLDPSKLTMLQQHKLADCLLSDSFNIRVVAKHLNSLILFDNPQIIDTSNLTDEQIILAGSRYNRGIEREKDDFVNSISSPVGNINREYSSYGRRIIEKKSSIYEILGIK